MTKCDAIRTCYVNLSPPVSSLGLDLFPQVLIRCHRLPLATADADFPPCLRTELPLDWLPRKGQTRKMPVSRLWWMFLSESSQMVNGLGQVLEPIIQLRPFNRSGKLGILLFRGFLWRLVHCRCVGRSWFLNVSCPLVIQRLRHSLEPTIHARAPAWPQRVRLSLGWVCFPGPRCGSIFGNWCLNPCGLVKLVPMRHKILS